MLDFATALIEWLTGVWSFLFDFMAAIPGAFADHPGALVHLAVLYVVGAAVGVIAGRRRFNRNR